MRTMASPQQQANAANSAVSTWISSTGHEASLSHDSRNAAGTRPGETTPKHNPARDEWAEPYAVSRFAHDFSRIPVRASPNVQLQAGSPSDAPAESSTIRISAPGDNSEREADRVAGAVMASGRASLVTLPTISHLQCCATANNAIPEASRIVGEVLASPGEALESGVQTFLEPRFSHDFSRVRVHTDARAAEAASAINARAFTSRRDIVFAQGEYAPHTRAGRMLLSHELTHVIQQQSDGVAGRELSSRRAQTNNQRTATDRFTLPSPAQHVAPIIQRQSDRQERLEDSKGEPKADLKALLAQLEARFVFLASQYAQLYRGSLETKLSQRGLIPSPGGKVHEALAFAFLSHNPGALIKSITKDVVAIDTREIPEWKEKKAYTEDSYGSYLATHFPSYEKFFITGAGTLWITRAGAQADPESYREFFWNVGDVPEAELAEILDPWYTQDADSAGEWITKWDSEKPREAPAAIQFIADLNPIMSVMKVVSILSEDKAVYAMPGTKATTMDKVEAWAGVLALGESLFGNLLARSVKGVQAAKVVGVARIGANPFGYMSEQIVKNWSQDEVVKAILKAILEAGLNSATWDGVVPAIEQITKPKKKPIKG